MGFVTVTGEKVNQLLIAQAAKDRRIRDLVAVKMQDRKHRPVTRRIEKLVGMPTCREWPGLALAIAHYAAGDQVRIIEDRAIGVDQGIAQLSTFMNRARCLRSGMTRDAARKRELLEELSQAFFILLNVWIEFCIGAFKVCVRHYPRPAVPRPADINHIEVVLLDRPIAMDIDEIQSRSCPPMSQQAWFDVLEFKRLA
jgi:hypothetical protein